MLPIPIGNHVALRFDEFFHGILKPPRKTNGNLKLVVILVESNTMEIDNERNCRETERCQVMLGYTQIFFLANERVESENVQKND